MARLETHHVVLEKCQPKYVQVVCWRWFGCLLCSWLLHLSYFRIAPLSFHTQYHQQQNCQCERQKGIRIVLVFEPTNVAFEPPLRFQIRICHKSPKNSGANSANLGKDSPNWVMLARENSIDRLSYSMTMYQSVRKQNFDQSTDLNELITRKPCHWQTTRLTPRRAGAVGDSPLNGLPEGPVMQSKVLSWVDMSLN